MRRKKDRLSRKGEAVTVIFDSAFGPSEAREAARLLASRGIEAVTPARDDPPRAFGSPGSAVIAVLPGAPGKVVTDGGTALCGAAVLRLVFEGEEAEAAANRNLVSRWLETLSIRGCTVHGKEESGALVVTISYFDPAALDEATMRLARHPAVMNATVTALCAYPPAEQDLGLLRTALASGAEPGRAVRDEAASYYPADGAASLAISGAADEAADLIIKMLSRPKERST